MKDITSLLLPDIHELLQAGTSEELQQTLSHLHPADLADLVAEADESDKIRVFEVLGAQARVETFEHLEEEDQLELVNLLGRRRMVAILDAMSSDNRADFIKVLPQKTADVLLPLLAQAERNDVRRLVSYPEETAGALMTTEYAALRADVTVSEALARLRDIAPERETIYYVYVVQNSDRKLLGVVTLTELVRAAPGKRLEEIMNRDLITIPVATDQEEAARAFEHYDFLAMPVVDDQKRLLGIITHDDILDVVQEESTEDAHRMGAVEPLEDPYLKVGFWSLARKRGLWLSVLFFGEMFTTSAMGHFEGSLDPTLGLIFFIPLILSSGGNSGSQSASLITRALALGEVRFADVFRVFFREISMGVVLGGFLGTVGFLRAFIWDVPAGVPLVVALALVGVVTIGTLLGSLLPLFFQRIGLDPAVTSTPFVASLVDVMGIILYFEIARQMLLG
jgi:magnesium transporter